VEENRAEILIVDDEPFIRDIVSRKLTAEGYSCAQAGDAEQALSTLARESFECILSDINMPGLDGIELLRRVRLTDQDVAVIMMTGAPDIDVALEAMRLGAHDHLAKPLNLDELVIEVERAVEKRQLVVENREYQRNLESMVDERTKQLHEANEELRRLLVSSIKSLAHALEAKDPYTRGHSDRVAETAVMIAGHLALDGEEIENVRLAGILHDIGKIGIREGVLNKPGKLSAEEWVLVKEHPVMAERILGPIAELKNIIGIVRHHHERFDGSGYPDGLEGSGIPLGARILAVADAFDALTSKRSYRDALSVRKAVAVLEEERGTQFDPVVVRAFLTALAAQEGARPGAEMSAAALPLQDAKGGGNGVARPCPPGLADQS